MGADCGELTAQQQRAIDLLLIGSSNSEIAQDLDVDRSTVWRWQQEPRFKDVLEEARGRRRDDIRETIDAGAWLSVHLLRHLVESAATAPYIRLRAGMELIKLANLESDRAPSTLVVKNEPWTDQFTPAQLEALRNCPDGLTGIYDPEAPLPPPPTLPELDLDGDGTDDPARRLPGHPRGATVYTPVDDNR